MGRLTNDKIVAKHRAKLCRELESVRNWTKPSYIWDLTEENCHQIYARLLPLYLDQRPRTSTPTSSDSSVHRSHSLAVLELYAIHNSNSYESNDNGDGCNRCEENHNGEVDVITFFGSIPHIVANINKIIVELDTSDSHNRNLENELNVLNETECTSLASSSSCSSCSSSCFQCCLIDVSASLSAPRIMQDKETSFIGLKYLLLHVRDYLRANIDVQCINVNHCLNHTNGSDRITLVHHFDRCFLTGIFLGYPIIYCNRTPTDGNCLSHQPLINYSVNKVYDVDDEFQLSSFSIPQMFEHKFHQKIYDWFQELRKRDTKLRLVHVVESHPLILT